MFVRITEAGLWVDDPTDLRSLAVRTRVGLGSTVEALRLRGLATEVDHGHTWLSLDALKEAADVPDPGWADRFDAMIDSVRPYGWVSDDGRRVRAHVEEG